MDVESAKRFKRLRDWIVERFDESDWHALGAVAGTSQLITEHDRLLRSLRFGDTDYPGNATVVLAEIVNESLDVLGAIEEYVGLSQADDTVYVSARPSERRIAFAPQVFAIPDSKVEEDLVAVMMPFAAEFSAVYAAIQHATTTANVRCLQADNTWVNATIIQDIFDLIFRSPIVVVDFSGRNPNVMYEAGIAHTLGKHVIPITQSLDDVPFDLRHHRVLKYLSNSEGLNKLARDLVVKIQQLREGVPA